MSSSERVFDSWQVTVQTERKRVWLQAHSDSVVNWKPKSYTSQLERREDTKNQSVKWKLKILIKKAKKEQGKKSTLGRDEDDRRYLQVDGEQKK